jgi:hypothetical protein
MSDQFYFSIAKDGESKMHDFVWEAWAQRARKASEVKH